MSPSGSIPGESSDDSLVLLLCHGVHRPKAAAGIDPATNGLEVTLAFLPARFYAKFNIDMHFF
ncbi:MAG TPA: hypothetical protein VMH85_18150 [Terriglobales bacterium]|nr:hypothetical protein [Terriglobales bacterium]